MRYVIIPLAIILYFYWTYKTVVDFIKTYKEIEKNPKAEIEGYTAAYLLLHIALIAGSLIHITIKFW